MDDNFPNLPPILDDAELDRLGGERELPGEDGSLIRQGDLMKTGTKMQEETYTSPRTEYTFIQAFQEQAEQFGDSQPGSNSYPDRLLGIAQLPSPPTNLPSFREAALQAKGQSSGDWPPYPENTFYPSVLETNFIASHPEIFGPASDMRKDTPSAPVAQAPSHVTASDSNPVGPVSDGAATIKAATVSVNVTEAELRAIRKDYDRKPSPLFGNGETGLHRRIQLSTREVKCLNKLRAADRGEPEHKKRKLAENGKEKGGA